ncbi:MAG: P-II family nitrogen regulator [Methylocella sp.]|jgi:nitrogen regulatory protein PII
MKLVVATIRTFKLEDVQEALTQIGITRFNVTEAKRFGPQKGHTVIHRGAQYATGFVPKIKVEVVVSDSHVDKVVDTIARSARTGEPGDGEIIVTCIDRRMGIHTGKTDFEAK